MNWVLRAIAKISAGLLSALLIGSSPVAGETSAGYSAVSVEKGERLYLMHCTTCHGRDAKARIDFVSNATDLTVPARYRNGSTYEDVFRSLSEGAGTDMPPFKYTITNVDDRRHLINFIISMWTPNERKAFLGDQNDKQDRD